MINELLLISGNDVPFAKAHLTIHQPTLKEIAYIGEETFFAGCELLNFSKDLLSPEDKSDLEDKSDFDIFMSIMRDRQTKNIQRNRICAMMVISLMFPDYHFKIGTAELLFSKTNKETNEEEEEGKINNDNYEEFKSILADIFCLNKNKNDEQNYNAKDKQGREIAEKLKKARVKVAESRGENTKKISVFSRYASVLSIGLQQSLPSILQYTVFQLFDSFERFELKNDYDFYLRAKLAGAKDVKEVDNWMKELH